MLPIAEDRRHPFGICIWCSRVKNKPKQVALIVSTTSVTWGLMLKVSFMRPLTFSPPPPYNVRCERNLTL